MAFSDVSYEQLCFSQTHLQARLAAKEQQLLKLRNEYGKLKQDHDRAKERLQEEMAAVRELEAQLVALSK